MLNLRIITRNGVPVALIVGLQGMDMEQVRLGGSDESWKLIAERRRQVPLIPHRPDS